VVFASIHTWHSSSAVAEIQRLQLSERCKRKAEVELDTSDFQRCLSYGGRQWTAGVVC